MSVDNIDGITGKIRAQFNMLYETECGRKLGITLEKLVIELIHQHHELRAKYDEICSEVNVAINQNIQSMNEIGKYYHNKRNANRNQVKSTKEYRTEINTLTTTIADQHSNIAHLKNQLKDLKTQNDRLTQKLKKKRNRLSVARKEIAERHAKVRKEEFYIYYGQVSQNITDHIIAKCSSKSGIPYKTILEIDLGLLTSVYLELGIRPDQAELITKIKAKRNQICHPELSQSIDLDRIPEKFKRYGKELNHLIELAKRCI